MRYVLIENEIVKKYPYSLTDMRFDNKGTSFPVQISDTLAADFGVYPVIESERPSFDIATENMAEAAEFVDGKWVQQWSITEKTDEEKAAYIERLSGEVREQRNQLLVDHVDKFNAVRWSALTPEQQQQWIDYRQALLDVPKQSGFPLNIIWPILP